MIDNYDSFVYNLVRYFEELGTEIVVYRNDEITIEEIEHINPKGIIISPGPKAPVHAGVCLDIIKAFQGRIPILGICLGYQAIIHSFGGNIIEGKEPVHGKVSSIQHDGLGIFQGVKESVKVTRYHSLIADRKSLPDELKITSKTKDQVIMGIRHKEYNIEGVQFHPEAVLTEDGHKMLQNFIEGCEDKKC
ncbi:aminodeoxychorismate/anthranilate synthase component II [Vallitalea okinawensis]|nr:aminodeoxychorismate/anthranilate synthase component II [Vallitalea okinawensis]